MKEFSEIEMQKAKRSLKASEKLLLVDPDSSASRAYYAAFHAVTALFAAKEKDFTKHSALRAAVHRDLVKTKLWPISLGEDYDFLMDIREIGDYGGLRQVSKNDAEKAIECAKRIIKKVESMQSV